MREGRLDREFAGKFGSVSYAREELIAELSAAFIMSVRWRPPSARGREPPGQEVVDFVDWVIGDAGKHVCELMAVATGPTPRGRGEKAASDHPASGRAPFTRRFEFSSLFEIAIAGLPNAAKRFIFSNG